MPGPAVTSQPGCLVETLSQAQASIVPMTVLAPIRCGWPTLTGRPCRRPVSMDEGSSCPHHLPAGDQPWTLIPGDPAVDALMLAASADLDSHQAQALALHAIWRVRRALARSTTDGDVLLQLAGDGDIPVRMAAADNPTSPAAAVELLANDVDLRVRRAAARHSSLSSQTAARMATADPDISVRQAAASNPAVAPAVLAGLPTELAWIVAQNPSTPGEVLVEIARRQGWWWGPAFARNPATPERVWTVLRASAGRRRAEWGQTCMECLAEAVGPLPTFLLEDAARHVWALAARLAAREECPPDILAQLAGVHDPGVALRLATNLATPPAVLRRVARESSSWVRREVARHPNTPPATLGRLGRTDRTSLVRSAVAAHPRTPQEILALLAGDEIPGVREEVAGNPAASASARVVAALSA